MNVGRAFGILAAGIGFLLWAGTETPALAQVSPQHVVETIDVQVLRATNIAVGRVSQITTEGDETVVTLAPEETLKGNPLDSSRRTLKRRDARPYQVIPVPDIKSRVLAIDSVIVPLDKGNLAVPTARGVLLHDPQETIDYVVEVLRTFPGGSDVQTFQHEIPKGWAEAASPPFVYITFSHGGMIVPDGPFLRKWALDAFNSGADIVNAEKALRQFRSDETVQDLLPLLSSTFSVISKAAERNLGIEVRSYPVREAAYRILTDWNVTVQKPALSTEVSRIGEVTTIVWFEDRSPTDEEIARLLEARNIEALEVFQRGITDAQMATIGRLTTLKSLRINSQITNAGLKEVLTLTKLEQLDLSLTRITDRGLAGLRALPNLRRLQLGGTAISDDGLESLAGFPKLEYIAIMPARTTEDGIAAIRRTHPALRISTEWWGAAVFGWTNNESMASLVMKQEYSEDLRKGIDRSEYDVNAKDFSGTPVILYAAYSSKNTEGLQLLLDKGARVNDADPTGATALHWAARYARSDAMKLLLDRGADVRAGDSDGNTPLHFAARQADPEPARRLLAAGADPSIRNGAGETAVAIAKRLGHKTVEEALANTR